MTAAFVRQLGAESGVQLNPLKDNSEIPSTDNSDQCFGIVMRATRGRIDRPFTVDRGTVYTKLGYGESIRLSDLNEAWIHVVEALNNGAYEAVVSRLSTDKAKIKWAVCKAAAAGKESDGVGQAQTGKAVTASTAYSFEVSESDPSGEFLFAVKHLECFNDGIVLEFHAEETIGEESEPADNPEITLRVKDVKDNLLYEFTGSLDPNAVDDYGASYYLPDVVAAQTDALEVKVGVTGVKAVVAAGSAAYGYAANGTQNWCASGTLLCFDEGGTDYQTADYQRACSALQYSQNDFAYISSGGSQSTALLAQLAQLAYDTNRQLRFDISGKLTPDAAIAFLNQLNFGANKCAHLLHAFWSPLKSDDPTGVNPAGVYGVATLNIALACARNAVKDANGFAKKNYPIAGREYPVNRTRIVQLCTVTNQDKNKLARAKINPVIYETYTGGGRYVFFDSLTCALVDQSLRKLIAVADMSTTVDDAVTRAAKDYLQLPMDEAVSRLSKYLTDYFDGAKAAKWIVASSDPMMEGNAYRFVVQPNAAKPYDAIDVSYWVRYDGTNRQTFVTQTITR